MFKASLSFLANTSITPEVYDFTSSCIRIWSAVVTDRYLSTHSVLHLYGGGH